MRFAFSMASGGIKIETFANVKMRTVKLTEIVASTFQLKLLESNDKQKLWFTRFGCDVCRHSLIDGQWQRQIQSNFPSIYPISIHHKSINSENLHIVEWIWLIFSFVKRFVEYKWTQFNSFQLCMKCLFLLTSIWSFNPLLQIARTNLDVFQRSWKSKWNCALSITSIIQLYIDVLPIDSFISGWSFMLRSRLKWLKKKLCLCSISNGLGQFAYTNC